MDGKLDNGPRGRRKDQEFMVFSMTPRYMSNLKKMLVANSAGMHTTIESFESWALKGVKGTRPGAVTSSTSTLAHEIPRKSNQLATKARPDMALHMRESPDLGRNQ